jgi:hypothetical protein
MLTKISGKAPMASFGARSEGELQIGSVSDTSDTYVENMDVEVKFSLKKLPISIPILRVV